MNYEYYMSKIKERQGDKTFIQSHPSAVLYWTVGDEVKNSHLFREIFGYFITE